MAENRKGKVWFDYKFIPIGTRIKYYILYFIHLWNYGRNNFIQVYTFRLNLAAHCIQKIQWLYFFFRSIDQCIRQNRINWISPRISFQAIFTNWFRRYYCVFTKCRNPDSKSFRFDKISRNFGWTSENLASRYFWR